MQRKNVIILAGLIAVALIGGVLAMYGTGFKPDSSSADNTMAMPATGIQAVQGETTPVSSETDSGSKEGAESSQVEIINSEDIEVQNNSLEYDLKAAIYENSLKEVYLKLEYYNDGTGIVKELGTRDIPELQGIFAKRQGQADMKQGYRVKSLFLNIKNAKAYFAVEGEVTQEWAALSMYSFNLKDSSLKKLYDGEGSHKAMAFSRNSKYSAFSFAGAEEPDNSYLQVISCENDEMVVSKNRDAKGAFIGGSKESEGRYHYAFLSWYSNSILKLKETSYVKDADASKAETKKQREILYDVEKNVFLNPDGSVMTDEKGSSGQEQVKAESEPVKTLRSFYLNLSTEQYDKAYDILDDKFMLNAFKLLGVTELSKADIDVKSFSVYGSLFRTARLGSIVGEKEEGNISTVYFYQSFSMGESDQVMQALEAQLKKTDNGWKVVSVDDGNINEKPFKQ